MKNTNLILGCLLAFFIAGCASPQKAELASDLKPHEAVSEANEVRAQGVQIQSDLLSFDEYSEGMVHLQKARRGLQGNYQKDYIIENAAIAKGFFQQALTNAERRTPNAERILQARWAAVDAGLQGSPELLASLADIDDDLRDETDTFAESLDPQEFAEFQKRYLALEIRAVQFRELDRVHKAIHQASGLDAEDLAPNSLRLAMLDVSEANNMIGQSPRNQAIHGPSVTRAVDSAVLLTDVMRVILDAPGTPEDIALKIVHQNRQLEQLSKNVGSLQQDLDSTRTSLMQKDSALQKQNAELQSARSTLMETETALMMQNEALEKTSAQVRFQRAMDEAMRQFSEADASVYQQGDKLIFRIKTIKFNSGSATIPASSKPLLSKIDSIIQSVGAEMVAVQGHTDSVGSAEINKSLSTKRAVSVANYLASLAGGYKIGYIGYGESRPIASNETQEGRAINRRVDLVVTARK